MLPWSHGIKQAVVMYRCQKIQNIHANDDALIVLLAEISSYRKREENDVYLSILCIWCTSSVWIVYLFLVYPNHKINPYEIRSSSIDMSLHINRESFQDLVFTYDFYVNPYDEHKKNNMKIRSVIVWIIMLFFLTFLSSIFILVRTVPIQRSDSTTTFTTNE